MEVYLAPVPTLGTAAQQDLEPGVPLLAPARGLVQRVGAMEELLWVALSWAEQEEGPGLVWPHPPEPWPLLQAELWQWLPERRLDVPGHALIHGPEREDLEARIDANLLGVTSSLAYPVA